MIAEKIMLVIGFVGSFVTVYWVRKHELREKYAMGWLAMAGLVLFFGIFPGVLRQLALLSRVAFPTMVLAITLAILFPFAFSVSISLSRSHRRNIRLTQRLVLLEERFRRLEREATSSTDPQ